MKTYGQYCPVARALEVVGDRWSLLIVRDLLLRNRGFNELERGLPGISRSLLAQRLRLLERGGVVGRELGSDGRARAYLLTSAGRELAPMIDAAWLLTSMLRRRRPEELPAHRIVIEFRLRAGRRPMVWLVLDGPSHSEVCLKDPGFPADLVVSAETRAFFRVWLGRLPRGEAERRGLFRIDGARELVRAFPEWFDWPSVPPPAVVSRGRAAGMTGRPS